MNLPFPWLSTLNKALLVVALFAVVGYVSGHMAFALLIGVSGLLLLHFWQMYRFGRWLSGDKTSLETKPWGIWRYFYQTIQHKHQRHRQNRKSLIDTIRFFHLGAEALPDAAVMINTSGQIVWANRLAKIELGLNLPSELGQDFLHLVNIKPLTDYLQQQDFKEPLEVSSPVNSNKVLEFRVVPYDDQQLLILVRDVTRLSQIEKMRKDFVANVSHELKTPLTVISGYLEMLPEQGEIPNPILAKALSEMRSQSVRMDNLIDELLVLSRIEASTQRVFEKRVNVPQMLWQIQKEADALNRHKKHKLFFDISSHLQVYGVETELRSAFSNLIFNAIHYTPKGGVIEVKWALEGQQAKFSVKDNGQGIAEEHLGRLTERFYRVDKARSRSAGGSGLGLAIVKHVLSHHNSMLHIQSRVGKGSTFSCGFAAELTHQHTTPESPNRLN